MTVRELECPPPHFQLLGLCIIHSSSIFVALLRCNPPSPFQVIWTKTIVMQGFGTGGRLCSPNLRFWRPALSIELHPYIYRLFDGTIRVGSGFPGAWLNGCGFHQDSSPQLRRWMSCSFQKLLLFTAISAQWYRMRGTTSRPELWAGTTCGIYAPGKEWVPHAGEGGRR